MFFILFEVEGHHEAIVSSKIFEAVQSEIYKRKSMGQYSGVGLLYNSTDFTYKKMEYISIKRMNIL